MSKELEALEKLGNIDVTYNRNGIEGCYSIKDTDEFEIIENTLKRQDSIEITAIDIEQDNKELCKENKKLKQVLEIIKRKGCSYMEISLIVSCNNYEEYCIEMNSDRVYSSGYECTRAFKTQEEFELLKKVLYYEL